jgi:acyl carrier protein
MRDIEAELKRVIVETLVLPDVKAEDIDSEAPLFNEGLGLDSIDALELAIEIGKRYGVRIKSDDERNREIFRSVRALAAFIATETSRGETKP